MVRIVVISVYYPFLIFKHPFFTDGFVSHFIPRSPTIMSETCCWIASQFVFLSPPLLGHYSSSYIQPRAPIYKTRLLNPFYRSRIFLQFCLDASICISAYVREPMHLYTHLSVSERSLCASVYLLRIFTKWVYLLSFVRNMII